MELFFFASWRGVLVLPLGEEAQSLERAVCLLERRQAALSCPLERRRCLWNVVFASWRGGPVFGACFCLMDRRYACRSLLVRRPEQSERPRRRRGHDRHGLRGFRSPVQVRRSHINVSKIAIQEFPLAFYLRRRARSSCTARRSWTGDACCGRQAQSDHTEAGDLRRGGVPGG